MTTPNVIIGGAPKCGTTSLFDWLSDHPDVCVSSVKETRYFLDSYHPLYDPQANWATTGRAGYERFFGGCSRAARRVVLEATPAYINQETARTFIPALRPRPLMLFCLRRPSERVYSMFQYARNVLGVLPPDMTFAAFIALDPGGYRSSAASCVAYLALEQSRYAHHISQWIERCGRNNVAVFLFESMKNDAPGFMRALSARLGISAAFWRTYPFSRRNEGLRVRSHGIHRALRRAAARLPRIARPDALKRLYYLVNAGRSAGIPAEDGPVLAALDERFRPEQAALARLLDIDLSPWG
jgi:hypothetical protein